MDDYLEQKLQDASGAYAGEYLFDYEKIRISTQTISANGGNFGSPCKKNFFSLFYFIEGSATLQWKGEDIFIKKGSCFLYRPTQENLQLFDQEAGVACNIDFVPQIFNELIAEPKTISQLIQSLLTGLGQMKGLDIPDLLVYQDFDGAVAELVQRCCKEYQNRPLFYTDVIKNHIKSIITIVSRSIPDISPAFSYSDIVQYMLDYIHGNYMSGVTLKKLGEYLHYNPTHLSAVFQKEVGYSFNNYLARRRIYASTHILRNTNITVEQVAREVGYKKTDNFVHNFKCLVGMTPTQYRGYLRKIHKWFEILE